MKVFEGLGNVASRVRQLDFKSNGAGHAGSPKTVKIAEAAPKPGPNFGEPIPLLNIGPSRLKHNTSQPKSKQEWFEQLLASEDEYCELMAIFKDEYVRPIKDDSKNSKPLYFNRQEFQKLVVFLSNVEALHTLNSRFRDDLRTKKAERLGEVLSQYASLFQMYGQYSSDIAAAEACISQQAELNEKFAQFLQERLETTRHSITNLLRIPLDRINEYADGMVRLCELCPNDEALMKASEELGRTAEFVQGEKEATRRLDRLKQLTKQWVKVTLTGGSPTRQFIMEGDLNKFNRKRVTKCSFLLFTDVLMYGAPIAGEKVRFKRSLPLATMVIEDASGGGRDAKNAQVASLDEGLEAGDDDAVDADEDAGNSHESVDANAHAFFILTPEKSFRVAAESAEAKAQWIHELKFRISAARQVDGKGEQSMSDLRPVWVPDVDSKACMRCNTAFTIMRRRHHCRRCGKLVCQPCSRSRMSCAVPSGKDKTKSVRVRVCDDCATKPPSVRYSLPRDVVLPQFLSSASDRAVTDDGVSSDDESRRLSMSSANGSAIDPANLKFDDSSAAPQPGLICVVIEPRPREQLQNADEVELFIGDEFKADEITEGWAVGVNMRSGEYGFAPANFMHVKGKSEEPPFNWDGMTAGSTPPGAPPSVPLALPSVQSSIKQRVSSGSFSSDTGGSPRIASGRGLPVGGNDLFNQHSSQRRSVDEDLSKGVMHRRTGSNQASDDGKSHRRSGSNQAADERRGSSAAAGWSAPPSQLLTFSDKRSLIMNEMVLTERSYLSSLNALLSVFVRPLIADYKSGKPQFGGNVLSVMNEAGDGSAMSVFMSRLEHIVTLNSKLAVDLEARLVQWTLAPEDLGGNAPQCTCGDVFINYAPLFNMYDEYSSSYEFATKTLVDRERSDAKLAKFFEDQSQAYTAQLKQQSLLSLLITPIQRVPRYLLLLKELLKHTAEGHPDRPLVEKAIATISDVALHINEHIRERENTVALREIDRELGGTEQLTDNPSRVFLHRGDLIKRSRKADGDYHMWLFSDVLLYQKKTIVAAVYGKPKPPKRIEIKTLSVQDISDNEGEGPQYAFELRSHSKSFRVFAKDAQDKERWVRALQDAIEQATGGKSVNSKEVAPVWEQNTSACMLCEAHFTFLFRRHHCRACGRCVCDKCSKNRMLIRNVDESKEVRVCQICFDSLSGPQNSVAKRHALTSAIASTTKRGSAPTVPAVSASSSFKLASLGMGGTKRSQGEATGLSPRMAASHAAIVDHKQISALSLEMAERRRQRYDEEFTRSHSEKISTPERPTVVRSTSEKAAATSPVTPNRTPSSKDRAEQAVTRPIVQSPLKATSPPLRSEVTEVEETDMIKPKEQEAMLEVFKQIKREVPLEAPKAYAVAELPTPLPVARIASPAQLSPVNSPKLSHRPIAQALRATASPLSASDGASSFLDDQDGRVPESTMMDEGQSRLSVPERRLVDPEVPLKASNLPPQSTTATSSTPPPIPKRPSSVERPKASPDSVQPVASVNSGGSTSKPIPPAVPKRRPSSNRSGGPAILARQDSNDSSCTQDTEFDML